MRKMPNFSLFRASISPYIVAGFAAAFALPGVALSSCASQFVTPHSSALLTMTLSTKNAKNVTGSDANRLALSFSNVAPFIFDFQALTADGQVDTTFNGFVRISAHPGAISSITGNGAEGRNVQLTNGVATGITVNVLGAYGDTHLWAEDIGYVPADPAGNPPECADGIDNNNNGLIDFPADPGCAFANDDTEDGGSYTTGVSETLFFNLPRVADVRGVSQGGTATSFPSEQVQVDPGPAMPSVPCTDQKNPKADHKSPCVVVTRIAADGFYVTDITETRGFSSVYAYNFSAPPNMAICDRITSFGGTSSDFYGFTEVNYPTWTLDVYEGYDPKNNVGRPCGIPEPHVFAVGDLPVQPTTTTTAPG